MKSVVFVLLLSLTCAKTITELNAYYNPSRRVNYLNNLYGLDVALKQAIAETLGKNAAANKSRESNFLKTKNIRGFIDNKEHSPLFSNVNLTHREFISFKNFFRWIKSLLEECSTFNVLKPVCDEFATNFFSDIHYEIDPEKKETNGNGKPRRVLETKRVILLEFVNCVNCMDNNYLDLAKASF